MSRIFFFALFILMSNAAACHGAGKPVVHFGVNLRYHPITIYERYQSMMDYLTANTPYRFVLKISRDYQEGLKFLKGGETQVYSLGDGGVMEAMLNGAVPILKPLNEEGRPYYRCYFIVAADSPLRTLHDLKGKSLALGSKHSTTGNLIPRHMLWENKIPTTALRSVTNLSNHSTVLRAVLKGEYDAGAVKDTVAKQSKHKGWRVLAESEELPSVPLVVSKAAPPELGKAITEALMKLDRRKPEHRAIMQTWDAEYKYGFAPATCTDYRELTKLFKSIPYRCGTGCHR